MRGSRPCAGFFAPNDRNGGLFWAFVVTERGSTTINGQQVMRLGEHAQQ